MIIRVRTLSDVHIGSIYGLCPRDRMTKHTNPFQRWAISEWEKMCKQEPDDMLYLIGDIVDGESIKDVAKLCIPDREEQAKAAVKLIQPLIGKHTQVFGVGGSRYHDGGIARTITESLGGKHSETFAALGLEKYDMDGILFHHKSVHPSTEVKRIAIRQQRQRYQPRIGTKISAHLHRYVRLDDNGITVVHTPCWEFETDFMGCSDGFDIGSTRLEIDTNTKEIRIIPGTIPIPKAVFLGMQGWEEIADDREMAMEKAFKERKTKELKAWLKQNAPAYNRNTPRK